MDPETIAEDWYRRGFSCELWEDHPGHEWRNCVHETDELFMVLEGEIELEMAGQEIRPERGDELLIPVGMRHSVRNVGTTTSKWLHGCWLDSAQTD